MLAAHRAPDDGQPTEARVIDNLKASEVYVNKIDYSFDGGAITDLLECSRGAPECLDTMWGQDQLPPVYVTRRSALSSITAAELANRRIEILAAIFQGAEQPNPLRGAARPSRIQSASPGGPSDPSPDRATSIQDHLLLRKIAARNPLTGVLIWPTPSSLPRSATKSYQG